MPMVIVPSESLCEKHWELVKKVNEGELSEHSVYMWRQGIASIRGSAFAGALGMDADERMMATGYDGPMCCGVKPGRDYFTGAVV